jgi:hypothetical protein
VTIDDVGGGGCCYHQPQATDARPPTVLEVSSLQLWPMETRQLFERELAVSAVARIAEQTYAPLRVGGYRLAPPDVAERERIVQELEDAGFRWLLERSEPDPPLERRSDEERVTKAARFGAPRRLADMYASLILADLQNWVESEPFHRPLKALVIELLRYRTISGEHAQRVVAHVDEQMRKEIDELGTHN